MNYSFEYIDIILLAMIAGFILRLMILGKELVSRKSTISVKEVLKTMSQDQIKNLMTILTMKQKNF